MGDDHRQGGRRVGSLTIARHGASQGGGITATAAAPGPARALEGGRATAAGSPRRRAGLAKLAHLADGRQPVGDDHRQGGGITATAGGGGRAEARGRRSPPSRPSSRLAHDRPARGEPGRRRGSPGRQPAKLADGAGLADLAKLAHLADGRQPVGGGSAGAAVGGRAAARGRRSPPGRPSSRLAHDRQARGEPGRRDHRDGGRAWRTGGSPAKLAHLAGGGGIATAAAPGPARALEGGRARAGGIATAAAGEAGGQGGPGGPGGRAEARGRRRAWRSSPTWRTGGSPWATITAAGGGRRA